MRTLAQYIIETGPIYCRKSDKLRMKYDIEKYKNKTIDTRFAVVNIECDNNKKDNG